MLMVFVGALRIARCGRQVGMAEQHLARPPHCVAACAVCQTGKQRAGWAQMDAPCRDRGTAIGSPSGPPIAAQDDRELRRDLAKSKRVGAVFGALEVRPARFGCPLPQSAAP
jgi:hypothetical protein